jgi:hypothetical protein
VLALGINIRHVLRQYYRQTAATPQHKARQSTSNSYDNTLTLSDASQYDCQPVSIAPTTHHRYSPMQQPRPRQIRHEPYRHIIPSFPYTHHIPHRRINKIVPTPSTPHNMKIVLSACELPPITMPLMYSPRVNGTDAMSTMSAMSKKKNTLPVSPRRQRHQLVSSPPQPYPGVTE